MILLLIEWVSHEERGGSCRYSDHVYYSRFFFMNLLVIFFQLQGKATNEINVTKTRTYAKTKTNAKTKTKIQERCE